ncbi:hypothetical protein C6500_10225 [Candidatus Poribacteria bacterium]|nr:MAG: hypothetical protein C6500_10225 [Candidatus Poribacteria bacterium]
MEPLRHSRRTKLTEIESELQQIRIQSQCSIAVIEEKFKDPVGAVLDDAGRLELDAKGKVLFEMGTDFTSKCDGIYCSVVLLLT